MTSSELSHLQLLSTISELGSRGASGCAWWTGAPRLGADHRGQGGVSVG